MNPQFVVAILVATIASGVFASRMFSDSVVRSTRKQTTSDEPPEAVLKMSSHFIDSKEKCCLVREGYLGWPNGEGAPTMDLKGLTCRQSPGRNNFGISGFCYDKLYTFDKVSLTNLETGEKIPLWAKIINFKTLGYTVDTKYEAIKGGKVENLACKEAPYCFDISAYTNNLKDGVEKHEANAIELAKSANQDGMQTKWLEWHATPSSVTEDVVSSVQGLLQRFDQANLVHHANQALEHVLEMEEYAGIKSGVRTHDPDKLKQRLDAAHAKLEKDREDNGLPEGFGEVTGRAWGQKKTDLQSTGNDAPNAFSNQLPDWGAHA